MSLVLVYDTIPNCQASYHGVYIPYSYVSAVGCLKAMYLLVRVQHDITYASAGMMTMRCNK